MLRFIVVPSVPLAVLAFAVHPVSSSIPTAPVADRAITFRHEGVLGTSLDMTFVTASPADARRAEAVALAEIERLRRVLSTWDAGSEASRLQRDGAMPAASRELRDVLRLYQGWSDRTGGAYSARVGELTALWRTAAATQHPPEPAALATAAAALRAPAWTIDERTGDVMLLGHPSIDLNSLGKGYILDAAVRAVRREVASVHGGMVNIGGDIRTWGAAPDGAAWRVAVADPRRAADNAPALTRLDVGDASVSTSGGYARGYDIAGRHYSHILDARTGLPAGTIAGVTVVARDNATANALATSLSILTPAEGLALIAATPGSDALLVTADGRTLRSPGFARYEAPVATPSRAPGTLQATIAIDVTPQAWNRHRPYVAVWVSDTAGKHIRTLAMWGDRPKYLRELSRWWTHAIADPTLVDAVARATRPAGKYTLEWDGLDQAGAEVPAGTYQFWLEVAFEDGAHSSRNATVVCGATPASGTIAAADAFTGARIDCAVAKK